MASSQLHRAVLADEVTRDDIDDAMARCDLHLTNVVPATSELPAQLIYSADASNHVYMIEDGRLGVVYAAATGPGAQDVISKIAGELPSMSAGDLTRLDALLEDDPADVDAIRHLLAASVLSAPAAPATRDHVEQALGHAEVTVRNAALICITYAPSRAYYSSLAKIRDEDESLELRAQAKKVLDAVLGGQR